MTVCTKWNCECSWSFDIRHVFSSLLITKPIGATSLWLLYHSYKANQQMSSLGHQQIYVAIWNNKVIISIWHFEVCFWDCYSFFSWFLEDILWTFPSPFSPSKLSNNFPKPPTNLRPDHNAWWGLFIEYCDWRCWYHSYGSIL